ncbi:MAG: hypothetical protein LBL24_04575 [Bacteroidales bacterium]|jgi:hypothetical protein|nr:hypothetical protein [Bacteroidales bacterium]
MKQIMVLILAVVLYATTGFAQSGRLHVPPEYDSIGQKVYEGFDHMFDRVEEYVKTNGNINREGMDSVRRAAMLEFSGQHPEVEAYLSGNPAASPDAQPPTPKLQALLGEISEAIKTVKPKTGFEKLEQQLGKINLKAAGTLSEAETNKVYTVSVTSFYSTKYWLENGLKWQSLGEYVKANRKK